MTSMTQFESNVFNFVESVFGKEAAINNFCFWTKVSAALMYAGYIFTLPIKFVKLTYKNLKEKGVI